MGTPRHTGSESEQEARAAIVALSRSYGEGVDWVIGGGGNTSIKVGRRLFVKASGTTLGTITADQFVAMDRDRLDAIWSATYPADADVREEQALADLLAAREGGDTAPRPSVETLMHALFPHRLVVHTHPTLINGLTCARDGAAVAEELWGDDAIWIPTINPGYTLARDIADRVEAWREAHDRRWPEILIMQNHGITVAADDEAGIADLHARLTDAVRARVRREPAVGLTGDRVTDGGLEELARDVASAFDAVSEPEDGPGAARVARPFATDELLKRAATPDSFAPAGGAFTPDHIVYSGHRPCYVGSGEEPALALARYREAEGVLPKVVVVAGRGAVAIGANPRKAELAELLYRDTLKVAAYSESFGGALHMPEDQIAFIRGWEVEKFREAQSTGGA